VTSRGRGKAKQPKLRVIKGGRAAMERELLWLAALDGDEGRREALMRQLQLAANHGLTMVDRSVRKDEDTGDAGS
jgi:hypothetical protein